MIKVITSIVGYITRNVAGLLGVVEALFDLVEQVFIVLIRIVSLTPGDKDDKVVAAIHDKYLGIREATLTRLKDFLLKVGGLDV